MEVESPGLAVRELRSEKRERPSPDDPTFDDAATVDADQE